MIARNAPLAAPATNGRARPLPSGFSPNVFPNGYVQPPVTVVIEENVRTHTTKPKHGRPARETDIPVHRGMDLRTLKQVANHVAYLEKTRSFEWRSMAAIIKAGRAA